MATKPTKILLATKNPGKIAEMAKLLSPLGVFLVGIEELENSLGMPSPEVAETGSTFSENAVLKARAYSKWSKIPAIAEDSGLCVDALNGEPGIYSSRYSGQEGDDEANNKKLLKMLENISPELRNAHYHTSAVYLEGPAEDPLVVEGQWRGTILETPAGAGGFGYDPIFWVPAYNCSSAELPAEQKNELSHRGKAMRLLVDHLVSQWNCDNIPV